MSTAASRRLIASPLPPCELSYRTDIRFLHPGYDTSCNLLLRLPRVDRTSTGSFGVCHRTALLDCQVIANNSFDNSYLAQDREGQQPVQVSSNDILTETTYYLVVNGFTHPYPIVPSFQDWEFPHDKIPSYWPTILRPPISQSRCAITNFSLHIKGAHIIPKSETTWYDRNSMLRYGDGIGIQDINNSANILPLRVDMHDCFDGRLFVIIPKLTTLDASTPSYEFATHLISGDAAELWPKRHDTLVQYLPQKSAPYLFARFAWAILMHAKPFITQGIPRHVVRITADEEGKLERTVEKLSGVQLLNFYGGGGSKSWTPLDKRSRNSVVDSDEELSSDEEDVDDNLWDNMDKRQKRSRSTQQELSGDTELFERS